MKLILSRKGFDSKSGGCPSPIFPDDDTMFSLPIPDGGDSRPTYKDLRHPKADDLGRLVEDLTGGGISANRSVHMSPDLNPPGRLPRLFDQVGAAKGHLDNQGVKEGDLFLFFGLYRCVARTNDGWRYTQGPEQHVLWGWLQVGEKRMPQEGEELRCMCRNNNTRYVASAQLDLGGGLKGGGAKGAGVFPRFDERLLLTEPGKSVSRWRLPRWFDPAGRKSALTYHRNPKRWERRRGDSKHVYLQSVGRGQEFVLDCDDYLEAKRWASDLIKAVIPA